MTPNENTPYEPFWVCWNLGGRHPTKRHPTEIEARAEACRLAAKTGERIYVLQSVGVAMRTHPPVEYAPFMQP